MNDAVKDAGTKEISQLFFGFSTLSELFDAKFIFV